MGFLHHWESKLEARHHFGKRSVARFSASAPSAPGILGTSHLFAAGAVLKCWGRLGSINASSAPIPESRQSEISPDTANILQEAKSLPGENHCSAQDYNIEKQKHLQIWESSPEYNSASVKMLSKDIPEKHLWRVHHPNCWRLPDSAI